MLHPKTVHYPSGFPMPQTPPVFICSSPGPDPYESNDNLYEELDQHDSHSDMSHNETRMLPPQNDRESDNLNSSADTASVTDEITMTNNNNETVTMATSSSGCNRNGESAAAVAATSGVNENDVERRNRINVQMSNTAFSVATIFRDRNNARFIRQHSATSTTPRANANYYAPPHNIMVNGSNNRVNTTDANGQFLTNPRAMHCWNSTQQFCSTHYEPVIPSIYNTQCLNSNNYHHHNLQQHQNAERNFATMRNLSSLRSPHHINQNTINSRKNLWGWFRRIRT